MVYETDFYTTRRPYRASPSLSTYTVTSEPSRQIRILPGLGKVHVVHSYDRIVPYVGHKRLHIVTQPPVTIRLRPSTLYREFDRIENKLRPYSYNSYTNDYLNSDSHVRIVYVRNPISGSYPTYSTSTLSTRYYDPYYYTSTYYPTYLNTFPWTYYPSYYTPTRRHFSSYNLYPSERWLDLALYPTWKHTHFARMFDDESRAIRAQAANLLNQIHTHVPRKLRAIPLPYTSRYEELPARWSNDSYVHKMLVSSPSSKSDYTTYWSDPVKRQFSHGGRLACVTIVGNKGHPRRNNVFAYHDDPVRSDIQLLSYYINRFREEKKIKNPISLRAVLPPLRPSRVFSVPRPLEDASQDTEEMVQLKQERAARLAKIVEIKPEDLPKVQAKVSAEKIKKDAEAAEAKKKKDEEAARQAAEEEEMKKKKKEAEIAAAAKKQQAEKEEKAKKAAEESAKKEKEAKAAELERLAEQARQEELAKQAEIEKAKKEEEERARVEEEKRIAEAAKAEEERQQLLRLEELARQAEEEKEAELARQADELAELARQEAELAEKAKAEEEAAEQQRKEADAVELAQKEAELAELETKEKELTEQAEQARAEAEEAAHEVPTETEVSAEETAETPVENESAEAAESEPIVEEPESPVPVEEVSAAVEDVPEEEPASPTEE